MKKYEIVFIGREVNAIGITYRIQTIVEAENTDEAKLKLYDNYEHISISSINEIN
jgi:hypothetical protein